MVLSQGGISCAIIVIPLYCDPAEPHVVTTSCHTASSGQCVRAGARTRSARSVSYYPSTMRMCDVPRAVQAGSGKNASFKGGHAGDVRTGAVAEVGLRGGSGTCARGGLFFLAKQRPLIL